MVQEETRGKQAFADRRSKTLRCPFADKGAGPLVDCTLETSIPMEAEGEKRRQSRLNLSGKRTEHHSLQRKSTRRDVAPARFFCLRMRECPRRRKCSGAVFDSDDLI